jgi:hypothetical protein
VTYKRKDVDIREQRGTSDRIVTTTILGKGGAHKFRTLSGLAVDVVHGKVGVPAASGRVSDKPYGHRARVGTEHG